MKRDTWFQGYNFSITIAQTISEHDRTFVLAKNLHGSVEIS